MLRQGAFIVVGDGLAAPLAAVETRVAVVRKPAAETCELDGDLVRAQHEIDTARLDGVPRHDREARRFGSLREGEAAARA